MYRFRLFCALVCALYFVACQPNAPAPVATEPVPAEHKMAGIPSDVAQSFVQSEGKYFDNLHILDEKSPLNKRVKALLGANYGAFAERTAVPTLIQHTGSVWFTSACATGACTFDEVAVAFDTDTQNLFVALTIEGKTSVRSEQTAPNPVLLQNYLNDLK